MRLASISPAATTTLAPLGGCTPGASISLATTTTLASSVGAHPRLQSLQQRRQLWHTLWVRTRGRDLSSNDDSSVFQSALCWSALWCLRFSMCWVLCFKSSLCASNLRSGGLSAPSRFSLVLLSLVVNATRGQPGLLCGGFSKRAAYVMAANRCGGIFDFLHSAGAGPGAVF